MTTEVEFWVIWDLDGVLIDNTHRIHHLHGREGEDWKSYVAAAPGDVPHDDVVWLLESMHASSHFRHAVVTGRMEAEGENTKDWLRSWSMLRYFDEFHFRAEGDFRPAPEIKLSIIKEHFLAPQRRRLIAVFEDHPGTVAALRAEGITCLHVRDYK